MMMMGVSRESVQLQIIAFLRLGLRGYRAAPQLCGIMAVIFAQAVALPVRPQTVIRGRLTDLSDYTRNNRLKWRTVSSIRRVKPMNQV